MWPFNKKSQSIETKSTIRDINLYNDTDMDAYQVLLGMSSESPHYITPRDAYYMAERNSDLGSAISMICESISFMNPIIKDDEEIIRESPTIELLRDPSEYMRKMQFYYEIAESFLLTNEIYIVARGRITSEPVTLVPIRPYNVSMVMNQTDGLPQTITTQCDRDRRVYKRDIIKGVIRYIDDSGLNEIFPIIGVSGLTDEYRGRSRLSKLYYDVKMGTDGKRHNVSMLQNGMRTSAILMPDGNTTGGAPQEWTAELVKKLTGYLRSFMQGAGNAGNVAVISRKAKIEGLTQNNRDMDFLNLLGVSRESIYNLYRIPLPLILSDAMTLSNYFVAQRSYYTKAVFPVFDNIMDGLKTALDPRMKDIDMNSVISYDEMEIREMRPLLIENMKMLKETDAVSINEIRSIGGYEPDVNGDDILVTANKIPLSQLAIGPSFEEVVIDENTTEDSSLQVEADSGEEIEEISA